MPNPNCLRKLLNIALILEIISFLIKKFLGVSVFHEYIQNVIIPIVTLIIMNYYLTVFEERLNTNPNRNDPGRMQENTNRDNQINTRAINQGNILRNDNSIDLKFERNEGEEPNLSGDANERKSFKKFGDINEIYE